MRLWGLAGVVVLGCGRTAPPALAEVLVVVDGDWPASAELERLRVDLYDQEGHWFATRDVPDFGAARPVSFGVFSDDEAREKFTWVRLRAYPSGRLRDEPATGAPRLVQEGRDVTPSTEPDPTLTVDRLALVRLRPGSKAQLAITLHGPCIGAAVTLREGDATRGPVAPQAKTCVDDGAARLEVEEARTTEQGSVTADPHLWGVTACAIPPSPGSALVCIPGGPMLFGASDLVIVRGIDPTPERIVVVSRFVIDQDEVTVGQYRAALAAGLARAELPPEANPGPLGTDSSNESVEACTWTTAPMGREAYPINCIGRVAARAYCTFRGGDLPTEVQWEYAASLAGRARKASYVWGEDAPDCSRAIFGRGRTATGAPGACLALGGGPRPIAEYVDVTPLGVRGLGGGLTEWTLDKVASYRDACWSGAPSLDPSCIDEQTSNHIVRGGAWDGESAYLRTTARFSAAIDRRASILGFRCVRRGTP